MSPLLLCLVAGHFLAEFWLVPPRPADAALRLGRLLRDAVIVVVTLAVVCTPFGLAAIWPLLVALAVFHAGIELAAARLVGRPEFLRQGELWVFLGAQAMSCSRSPPAGGGWGPARRRGRPWCRRPWCRSGRKWCGSSAALRW